MITPTNHMRTQRLSGDTLRRPDLPLVSLLVVTFNHENYIKSCVESCVFQTYANIEIIVSDDCSSDGTVGIVTDLILKYPNRDIRLVQSTSRGGVTENCNRVFRLARGELLALIGGDDELHVEKISLQVNRFLENDRINIVYHDMEYIDNLGRKISGGTFASFNRPREGRQSTLIRHGTFNCGSSTMVRRSACPPGGFDDRLGVASDWFFWIQTCGMDGMVAYLPQILGSYRRHDRNVTKHQDYVFKAYTDTLVTIALVLSYYPSQAGHALFALLRTLRWRWRSYWPAVLKIFSPF